MTPSYAGNLVHIAVEHIDGQSCVVSDYLLCLYIINCLLLRIVGDEVAREMSSEMDRDQVWVGRHCDTLIDVSPQSDVNVDGRQPEPEEETTSGHVLNGRSPTPSTGECLPALTTTTNAVSTYLPELKKDRWSPEVASRRGSWESAASECVSDAWSSASPVPGLDDNNRMESLDGEENCTQPRLTDARTIIVVSDSSLTPPPRPTLMSTSAAQKGSVLPVGPATASTVSATDESVVRKLESFVESMNARRCARSTTIAWNDASTASSTSGLGRQSFPVCRPLPALNGLRGSGSSGVLLPFYVPFKTSSDMVEHPLDLSSKTQPAGSTSTKMKSTVALVQPDDKVSEVDDDGVSSLESLQKQFGENSAMLDRIGVRRHAVSGGVAQLACIGGGRIHGPGSPLNGVGLYGPALNEPCVPQSCRPVPVPHADGPAAANRCAQASHDAARSVPADRRSSRRLVRGQEAWMNGVSGRQRRSSVLRCLECNMSFWSLPELTLHMIKTAHYANIVRTSVVPAGLTPPEMTSSPTMTSSCSPADSDSSRESDVDNDNYFYQLAARCSDFRLAKPPAKRQHESTPNGDDCSKMSKIWQPDCPLSASVHPSSAVDRQAFRTTTSPYGRITPISGDIDERRPSVPEHDRAVTSSKSPPEQRGGAAALFSRSPGRSDDASDDGGVTRQPALTAMEDFISRSICELDRGKRRPSVLPLPPPRPPAPPPPNGLPPPMTVADLMFPLFPLAQFFPEQFLIASRAFNFLPLMQSMARLYGGLDVPPGAPVEFSALKAATGDDFDATRRRPAGQRTSADVVWRNSDRREDSSSKCHRVDGGGAADTKSRSRDRHDVGESLRPTSNSDGLHRSLPRDVDDHQKLSPTSSDVTGGGDGLPSTALDSLRGFVYGDRKRSEHAPTERRCPKEQRREGNLPRSVGGSTGQDDEAPVRRRPRQSPSSSSDEEAGRGVPSPAAAVPDSAPEAAAACGGGGGNARTSEYDSRFDKYYRLARELAGQL